MTFEEAWRELGSYAVGNVRRRAWEHLTRDEIVQTARIAVWESLRRFPDGPDRRYVIRCASFMAVTELTKAGILRKRRDGTHYRLPGCASLEAMIEADCDLASAVDVEESAMLWDAIGRLPLRQSMAILARDLWGYTPQEACSLTDVADITHRRDRSRGLRTLRMALA